MIKTLTRQGLTRKVVASRNGNGNDEDVMMDGQALEDRDKSDLSFDLWLQRDSRPPFASIPWLVGGGQSRGDH